MDPTNISSVPSIRRKTKLNYRVYNPKDFDKKRYPDDTEARRQSFTIQEPEEESSVKNSELFTVSKFREQLRGELQEVEIKESSVDEENFDPKNVIANSVKVDYSQGILGSDCFHSRLKKQNEGLDSFASIDEIAAKRENYNLTNHSID